MIIDTLANAGRYYSLHSDFKAAFEYLNVTDLNALETGTIEIAPDVKAFVAEAEGKTAEMALQTFECHNKNIDIQVCISGEETMGWKPRADCNNIKGDGYSDEKDVTFFNEKPDTYFTLKPGQFVIFFPEDVHAPMIGAGIIKKLVVKVGL